MQVTSRCVCEQASRRGHLRGWLSALKAASAAARVGEGIDAGTCHVWRRPAVSSHALATPDKREARGRSHLRPLVCLLTAILRS